MANNAYLLSSLEKGPIIVRWIVDYASPEVYDTKTDPERFTFREAVAHLADWEPILHDRMAQIRDRPGSTLTPYDEVQRAIDENYAAVDPKEAVERWAKDRAESVRFFREEGPDHFDKAALHPERGQISLYDLAHPKVPHDTYHIEQLLQFLKQPLHRESQNPPTGRVCARCVDVSV